RFKRNYCRRRRGTLYMAVMASAFIVSTVALLAVRQVRLNLKVAAASSDRYQAQMLAQSAIEHVVTAVQANPSWQSAYAYNTEYPSPPVAAGSGTFTWRLVNTGNGCRRIDGIGRAGKAMCVYSVDLSGRDYLVCGLSCGGNITVTSGNESIIVKG